MRAITVISFLLLVITAGSAAAQTLDRVRDSGVFKIGYRTDAMPFSFRDADGMPAGYSVELCRILAEKMRTIPQLANTRVEYVPIATEDRFKAIQEARIDILRGATTATLSRRQFVDFSIPIFVTGASVLMRVDGPNSFAGLEGRKIGVRKATTTEQALRNTLADMAMPAEVVTVDSHDDALRQVENGELAAYFGDRAILAFMMARSPRAAELRLANEWFTYEPYALVLQRGDSDFRLIVDMLLSRIYRDQAMGALLRASFGKAQLGDLIKAMFLIVTLPE